MFPLEAASDAKNLCFPKSELAPCGHIYEIAISFFDQLYSKQKGILHGLRFKEKNLHLWMSCLQGS